MIKFKEFIDPSFDDQVTNFFKEQADENPDDVFEYVELVVINSSRIMLVYRQTNRGVYQFRSLAKEFK